MFLFVTTYTGQIYDSETNLHYMNARYYNSETGQFISKDTYLGEAYSPWTQNLYSYTGNNPVNFTDPTGHYSVSNINAKLAIGRLTKSITGSLAKGNNKSSNKKNSLGKRIKSTIKSVFGAGVTSTYYSKALPIISTPENSPISIEVAKQIITLTSKNGDSSKPISVYGEWRDDDYTASTVGMKMNCLAIPIETRIGLNSFGVSGSLNANKKTYSYEMSFNTASAKIEFEGSVSTNVNAILTEKSYAKIGIRMDTILFYTLIKGFNINSGPYPIPKYSPYH